MRIFFLLGTSVICWSGACWFFECRSESAGFVEWCCDVNLLFFSLYFVLFYFFFCYFLFEIILNLLLNYVSKFINAEYTFISLTVLTNSYFFIARLFFSYNKHVRNLFHLIIAYLPSNLFVAIINEATNIGII